MNGASDSNEVARDVGMRAVFALLEERGVLLQPEAAAFLAGLPGAVQVLQQSLSHDAPLLLTRRHIEEGLKTLSAVPGAAGGPPPALPVSLSSRQTLPRLPGAPPAPARELFAPKGLYAAKGLLAPVPALPGAPAANATDLLARELAVLPGMPPVLRPVGVSPSARQPVPWPVDVLPSVAAPAPAPPELHASVHELHPSVQILRDVTGASTCTGEITDFTRLFNDRYRVLRKILRQRRELAGARPIDQVPQGSSQEVRIIAMINEVRTSKKGHRILEVEDDTGVALVLAPAGDPDLIAVVDSIVQDEVVGVIAKTSAKGDLLILQDVVRPDIPLNREPARAPEPVSVAFVSDLHAGSRAFLADKWERFADWLHGRIGDERQRALAQSVGYIIVTGDVVDGIGLYPGQENELAVPDIFDQYKLAGELFAKLPPRVAVFLQPGAHDAVRPAEPQPALPNALRAHFPPNVRFIGNPCSLALHGVSILAYHGKGIDDLVTGVKGLSYSNPIQAMTEMVRRRHLCPIYGHKTGIAPEHTDHLLIDPVPDVLVTGHVHAAGVGGYRGVTLVAASCWQSQTNHQKMLGMNPDPARVPLVDLQTGQARMLNFN